MNWKSLCCKYATKALLFFIEIFSFFLKHSKIQCFTGVIIFGTGLAIDNCKYVYKIKKVRFLLCL